MKRVAGTMKILMLSALVVAWLAAGSTVFSSDIYQGKRVSIIVPFGPGGGWDTYARLTARHMGSHVPGQPSFIVQNMPGAGGMVSYNHLFNRTNPPMGSHSACFKRWPP